jgi:hypothetical protein
LEVGWHGMEIVQKVALIIQAIPADGVLACIARFEYIYCVSTGSNDIFGMWLLLSLPYAKGKANTKLYKSQFNSCAFCSV